LTTHKRKTGKEEPNPMLETRYVDNPLYTAGLATYHAETGQPERRQIQATSNPMSRIGALCYIRARQPHQELAGQEFKTLYEARYGSGGGAVDASRVQVDTSHSNGNDAGMASRIDRTRKLYDAESGLGKARYNRLVALLVLCAPAGEGLHWRDRKDAVAEVLLDLDRLAAVWGYMSRSA